MTTCHFCHLELEPSQVFYIYDMEVCFGHTYMAELSYEGDEASDYIENLAFDFAGDR